jgi:hypothetical protein
MFFKDYKLFGQWSREFLFSPDDLAQKLGFDGGTPIEQHEPVKSPDQLFSEFLDDVEVLHREVDKVQGSMIVEEKPVTVQSLLEKQIVHFAAEELAINPFLLAPMRD